MTKWPYHINAQINAPTIAKTIGEASKILRWSRLPHGKIACSVGLHRKDVKPWNVAAPDMQAQARR